jgi:phosphoserine phosphatase RsbU/P
MTNIFLINLHQFLSTDINRGGILVKRTPLPVLLTPKEVVIELNRRFYFDLNDNPFFTIIYGITNLDTGKTKIVRAGHPFPIYQNADGKLSLIESEGYAVGMFPEIEVTEYEFVFEKHSRLILFSDGLIDSTFADINQTAFARLKDFVEKNKNTPLPDLIRSLSQEERKWHEKTIAPDDIIAFVIERQ